MKVHASFSQEAIPTGVASSALELLPGRVAVEMHERKDTLSGFHITDSRKERMRPMVGTVIAVGPTVQRGPRCLTVPMGVSVGDVVLVHPQDGKRVKGFTVGAYQAKNEVRLYGIVAQHLGVPLRMPWHESILGLYMNGTLYATGCNVLLRLQEKSDTQGVIVLPDNVKDRVDVAEILSMGPACDELSGVADVGDRVMYERRGLKQLNLEGDQTLAIIEQDGIYGKVQ